MSLRLISAWVLCGALVLAFAALLFWYPAGAEWLALLSALAGASAASLFLTDGRGQDKLSPDLAKQLTPGAKSVAHAARATAGIPASELLEAMLNSMREGMLVVDGELRVVASNEAARGLFGFDEGTGGAQQHQPSPRLGELTRNPAVLSAYLGAIERGERVETKVELTEQRRVFDLRVAPLQQRSAAAGARASVRGAVGVFFDITRLERLERVRQEFLSNVSHELRTPLTAIRTFVETLEDGALEDAANNRRFLSIIDRNAARMHSLIDDILELSAIEAGTATVEARPVRLRAMIDDVLTALASRASERALTLRNEVAEDVLVHADARRLEQMLTNLCDNAIKFSAEGGTVAVAHEQAGGRDRISVVDTGEGIAPEHIGRIFERFYRVDRARSRALGGTGLGLAIVKHLARAHGGEATVQSIPGEGSTFTIELPHSGLGRNDTAE
ncbi:MAG TPA: ATP-binding protein [Pyrinomonadaceae bacterium]|jgi:two-component system phosphate regulon sensor histidine kinase PhoR|nr:ATP-binding protein [Pyrinomonadaceae bacterium]